MDTSTGALPATFDFAAATLDASNLINVSRLDSAYGTSLLVRRGRPQPHGPGVAYRHRKQPSHRPALPVAAVVSRRGIAPAGPRVRRPRRPPEPTRETQLPAGWRIGLGSQPGHTPRVNVITLLAPEPPIKASASTLS